MKTITINGVDYKIKFSYRVLAFSEILKDVTRLTSVMQKSEDAALDKIQDIMGVTANLFLAGLQKYNENYKCDYEDAKSVKKALDKVYDLLDDLMDDDAGVSVMELFQMLTEELMNNGFLSRMRQEVKEDAKEQDATIIPLGHQLPEN